MDVKKNSKKPHRNVSANTLSDLTPHARRPKSESTKSKNPRQRSRAPKRNMPNTDAATQVVNQSVSGYCATKLDSFQAIDGDKQTTSKPTKSTRKRKDTQPKTNTVSKTRVSQKAQTDDRKSASRERPQEAKNTPRRASRKADATGGKKRDSKTLKASEQKPSRKSSQRTRSTTTERSAQVAPKRNQRAQPRKKTTKTGASNTGAVNATAMRSTPTIKVRDQANSQTPTKKKRTKETRKTAKTSRMPQTASQLTEEYVIGFQGIYYKPYRLTSKDLFMSGAQQDHFMDILVRAKDKLLAEEADRTSQLQESDASNLPDPLDQGTNEGVFHNQLRTRDRESQLVRKINRAIDCLKTGSYGYCEACGCEIPIRRLEARPIVTKCIDCKERDELRERQLGQ